MNIVIIVEGRTEKKFVDEILSPYLYGRGASGAIISYPIKHSHGGISKYSHVKDDLLKEICKENTIVTTMIDFYGLPKSFPGMREVLDSKELDTKKDHLEIVKRLEEELKKDIQTTQNRKLDNLIPYFQIHEFEALIFSSEQGIKTLFEVTQDKIDIKGFQQVLKEFSNPEDINHRADLSPSHRLEKIVPGYDKAVYGVNILKAIGIEEIRSKCPHFEEWVDKLVDVLTQPQP